MEDISAQLHRIFFGENSLWFLLEVVFRTTFIFSYTLLLLRWMGKRGLGQLSPFELAIIVALGSAVGDPMFYPDVPLTHAMIVIAVVITLQRFLGFVTLKHRAVEEFFESRSELLVHNGCVRLDQVRRERLSKNELFEMLRIEGISHLGQVRQAFLEPSGKLSVIRWEPARPGLTVLPQCCHGEGLNEDRDQRWLCCEECGATDQVRNAGQTCCVICGNTSFAVARRDQDESEDRFVAAPAS